MLNLPYCINSNLLPLKELLCAPFNSKVELELMFQLYSKVTPALESIMNEDISVLNIDTHTCSSVVVRKPEILKYCGLCQYNHNNVTSRLDNEIALLNHYYNRLDKGQLSEALFRYYFLSPEADEIFITKKIFTIIRDNYDSFEYKFAILTGLADEYQGNKAQVNQIVNLVLSKKSNANFDKALTDLQAYDGKAVKKKPSDSSKGTKKSNEIHNNRVKTEQTPTYEQASLFQFINSQIKSLASAAGEQHEEEAPKETNTKEQNTTSLTVASADIILRRPDDAHELDTKKSSNFLPFSECSIINEAIVGGFVVFHTNPLSISTFAKGISTTYSCEETDNEQMKVINLILANGNIWKILPNAEFFSIISFSGIIKNFIFSVHLTDSQVLSSYDCYELFKKLSLSERKKAQLSSELVLITQCISSSESNLCLSLQQNAIDPILIIKEAIKDGLFSKYSIRYSSHTAKTINLKISLNYEREALDRVLNITRKLLRQTNQTPRFEVTIND